MSKRLISLLLAVVMLLSLCLTACSNSSEDEEDEKKTDETLRQNVVLTIYAVTADSTTEEGLAAVEEKINNYCIAKYKTGIDLRFYKASEYQNALNDMYDKFAALDEEEAIAAKAAAEASASKKAYLKTLTLEERRAYEKEERIAAKKAEEEAKKKAEEEKELIEEGKDVAQVKDVQMDILYIPTADDYYDAIDQGLLLELNEYLNAGFSKIKNYVYPSFLTAATDIDALYGIPNNKGISSKETFFVVNTKLAEKYGVDLSAVHSIEDFNDVFRAVKAGEPGVTPIYGDFEPEGLTYIEPAKGVTAGHRLAIYTSQLLDENFDWLEIKRMDNSTGSVSKEFINYCALKANYRTNGYLSDTNTNFFLSVQELDDAERDAWEKKGYTTVLYRGAKFTTEDALDGGLYGISSRCEYPERAMEILELISCDSEFRNLLAFGVQGKNYIVSQDGKHAVVVDDSYAMDFFATGNTYMGYLADGMDPDYVEKSKEKNLHSRLDPMLGFHYDWSDEDGQKWIALFNKWEEQDAADFALLNYGTPDYLKVIARIESVTDVQTYSDFVATCPFYLLHKSHCKRLIKLDAALHFVDEHETLLFVTTTTANPNTVTTTTKKAS